ncbi:MAG: phage tail sheath family protein, partial [Methylobacteriaceae bacterium]|nr:phage tail sheath family protein [Methylobacteriaceae bacterium]
DGVATSIMLFIGGAADGPHGTASRIGSFADYVRLFGGLDARTLLGHSVMHFFANGGTDAYVLRLTRDGGTDEAVLTPGSDEFHAALLSDKIFGAGGAVDAIDLVNLVCIPGESDPAALAIVQAHCAQIRALLLIDADARASVASLEAGIPAAFATDDAANAAMFFPWLRAPDPLQAGALGNFPPCGFVAGALARNDRSHGVWKAASGLDATLIGVAEPAVAFPESDQARLHGVGVNCIRKSPDERVILFGARTLAGAHARQPEWQYIPVRRLALFLEQSIARETRWATFEPNNAALWAELRTRVGAFLLDLFNRGAFQGATPDKAFFVRCDLSTTTQSDIAAGIVNILVGFAPLKPAEFVILRIGQLAGGART